MIVFRCKHFVYVNVSVYSSVRGETGVTRVGGSERDRTQTYPDRSISDKFGVRDLAYLNNQQVSYFYAIMSKKVKVIPVFANSIRIV